MVITLTAEDYFAGGSPRTVFCGSTQIVGGLFVRNKTVAQVSIHFSSPDNTNVHQSVTRAHPQTHTHTQDTRARTHTHTSSLHLVRKDVGQVSGRKAWDLFTAS